MSERFLGKENYQIEDLGEWDNCFVQQCPLITHLYIFFLLGVILRMWFTAENLKYFRVKNFIEEVVISIRAEMCQNIIQCFYERLQICIVSSGTSVEKYKKKYIKNIF